LEMDVAQLQEVNRPTAVREIPNCTKLDKPLPCNRLESVVKMMDPNLGLEVPRCLRRVCPERASGFRPGEFVDNTPDS